MSKFIYSSDVAQENLKDLWISVSLSSFIEGKEWYFQAHNICQDMSDEYNQPLEVVCGILSALSPQKSWQHNLELTNEFFETGGKVCKHMINNRTKAKLIYQNYKAYKDGKSFVERILKGDKTVNFFNNILNPLDKSYCCLDTHMISICTGNTKLDRITTKQYDFLKKECIKFALTQKMIPCEVQATLWVQYRRAKKGEV